MSADPQDFSPTLVPLPLACEAIFDKLYRTLPPDLSREQLLNSIASTIAAVASIYEYSTQSGVSRRLSTAELVGGTFNRAGKELVFADGRTPRTSLAARANDIAAVVERLKEPAHK